MTNVKDIISGQNRTKLSNNPTDEPDEDTCSCQQNPCPLQGRCNSKDIVYKAVIKNVPKEHIYLGSTANRFIRRYHIHKGSLNNRESRNHTALSKKVWQLRDEGSDPKSPLIYFQGPDQQALVKLNVTFA